jgi:hypothetical protein
MTTEDEVTREAKQNLRQGVPDLVDMYEGMEFAESEAELKHMMAVAEKMKQLIKEDYRPEPMPELGKPTQLESGDLRFLAKSDAMRQRVEAALASGAVEDWIFFNGEEDDKVTGKVTSVETVHALAYFTVRAAEG